MAWQFESNRERSLSGCHTSDFLNCSSNKHLRRTFAHPDVLERGCARIEVSHYGCVVLSAHKVAKSWSLLRCQEAQAEEAVVAEKGLFVVQPPAAQWQNFVKHLDHCFLRADRLPSSPPKRNSEWRGEGTQRQDECR